ncbi:MAG: hypothetical protein K0S75_438, partial [Clostridia bacterium]|nr:hypothetical protein [Clostridia bacterium]
SIKKERKVSNLYTASTVYNRLCSYLLKNIIIKNKGVYHEKLSSGA